MPAASSSSKPQFLPASVAFSARVFDVLLRVAPRSIAWLFWLAVVGTATAQTSPVTLYASLSANPVLQGTSPAAIAVIGCTSACGTMTYLMDGQTFQVLPVNADGTIGFPPISSTLTLGSHTLTVQYSGNATYAATSATYSFSVVASAPTSLSLSLNVSPVPVNETPQMQGQLGCNSACGVVYFYLDGTIFQNSTATSTGLIGNLLGSNLPLGWHILTVSYPGNSTYSASATSIAFHVIPDVLPPVSLAIALPSAPYVTGTSPNVITALGCRDGCNGYLAWYLDGQLFQNWATSSAGGIASPPLVSGIAVGSHTLSVTYSGDSQNAPTSASYAFNAVSAASTSLTLSLPYNPVPSDEYPMMTGQIGCNTSCGNVYYYIDGTIFQTSTASSTGLVGNLLTPIPPLPYSEVAPGWHILTESYPGNSSYSASSVSIPFQIVPDTLPVPSLTATLPANPVIFGTAPNLTTTVGCGSNCSGQLTWYMDGTLFQNWSVNSNGVDAPSIVNGPALTMGPHTITIHYGGNAQYAPTTTSLSFVVTQATHGTLPVVTWAKPTAVSYGTTLSSTQLNATASISGTTLPGTFTYSPAAGTTPATGNDVLTVTFAPNDATDYVTTAQSVVLAVNKAVPAITWPQPAPITFGNQLTATQLNATATVSGTISYSPTLDSIPPTGVDQLTATFTPNDYTDYSVATQTVNLTVNKATPVITWPAPTAIAYGTALTTVQLDAAASVAGTFVYSPPAGTVPAAGSQALSVTFTPTDSTDYNAVTATSTINVLATPMLTFAPVPTKTYGVAPFAVSASSASTGTIAYSVSSSPSGIASISGSTVSITGAGTVTLTASQAATTSYAAATASVSFMVSQAIPTLTVTTSTSGTPSQHGTSVTLTATISSGLSGTVAFYDGGTLLGTANISGATATFATASLNAGTHSLTAYWAGSTNYSSVTSLGVTQLVTGIQLSGPGTISAVAGNGTQGFTGDGGLATAAELEDLYGNIAVDATGNLYFNDYYYRIRKVSAATGIITTVAGNGTLGYSGDGGLAINAEINSPYFTVDNAGNIYIDDANNQRIRKVAAATGIITTVAGNGALGYTGDGGLATAAEIDPYGVAVDGSGNIYFGNNYRNGTSSSSGMRKVAASTGIISTVPGNLANTYWPTVDQSGNILVYSGGNISKVSPSTGAIVSTVAGNGTVGHTGDGGPATSAEIDPAFGSVTLDPLGNIYFADVSEYAIRKVNASTGIISVAALVGGGKGCPQQTDDTGDGCLAIDGIFAAYAGPQYNYMAADSAGNIYLPDVGGKRIRGVSPLLPTQIQPSTVTVSCSPTTITYGGNSACSTSVSAGATGTVSLAYANANTNSVVYAPAVAIVSGATSEDLPSTIQAGTSSIVATYNGDNTHLPSVATATTGLLINQATPVLTWPTPAPITRATPLGSLQLNAFASVPGIFTYSPGFGSIMPQGLDNLNVTFVPIDGTDYTSASMFQKLQVIPSTPSVSWTTPAPIQYGTPLSPSQLNATADVPGTFVYNYAVGTVLSIGTQSLTVTFTPTSSVYNTSNSPITVTVQMLVSPDIPVITGVLPNPAAVGTVVTVFGQNFGPSQGSSTLKFNGVAATATSWTDNAIVTTVPAGATTGNLVVSVSANASNSFLLMIPKSCP